MLQRKYGARLDLPNKQSRTRVPLKASPRPSQLPSEWTVDESERAGVGGRKRRGRGRDQEACAVGRQVGTRGNT